MYLCFCANRVCLISLGLNGGKRSRFLRRRMKKTLVKKATVDDW